MKILFFGDIYGRPGRESLKKILPILRQKYEPDFVIANGDNLAHGKSITEKSVEEIFNFSENAGIDSGENFGAKSGIDFLTSGNHIWEQKQAWDLLQNKNLPILRPANFPPGLPGKGYSVVGVGTKKILVINLMGRVFMHFQLDDPLRKADEILEEFQLRGHKAGDAKSDKEVVDAIFVDWHCEASSEKQVLGWYLDGRVSAIVGSHTHIPTADEKILPGGTAFISDAGMVGPRNSVIGVKPEISMDLFTRQIPVKMEPAEGPVEVDAVLIEVDNESGLAKNIKRIQEIVKVD